MEKRAEEEAQEEAFPENPTPLEKVKFASKHKEQGTRFLLEGRLEDALGELDKAFILVFTPRDEWEWFYSKEDREIINKFKIPCHLNRGLCKLKLGRLEDALWDFEEAVRLDPKNAKAWYRRGLTYSKMVEAQLQDEKLGDLWDPEKVEKLLSEAKHDLRRAYELMPNDSAIISSLHNVRGLETKLSSVIREYRQQERKLFSFAFKKLEEDNNKKEALEEELPKLEKISLGYP